MHDTHTHTDMSSCLTVRLLTLENIYSLFVASCHLTHGNPLHQTITSEKAPSETTPIEISVIFSQRCTKSLNLKAGSHVRIHPPWYRLASRVIAVHLT